MSDPELVGARVMGIVIQVSPCSSHCIMRDTPSPKALGFVRPGRVATTETSHPSVRRLPMPTGRVRFVPLGTRNSIYGGEIATLRQRYPIICGAYLMVTVRINCRCTRLFVMGIPLPSSICSALPLRVFGPRFLIPTHTVPELAVAAATRHLPLGAGSFRVSHRVGVNAHD